MAGGEHNELVRRSFERQVPLFSGPDSPFALRAAGSLSWIEPLDPDMIVLDVACGAAHATEPVAPRVRQVVGIDLTGGCSYESAPHRLRDNGIGNVLLQAGNAESLPFIDESFDIVFCRSSLHHFDDPQRAVSEMVRVCRSGGRIVLFDLVAPASESRALRPRASAHRPVARPDVVGIRTDRAPGWSGRDADLRRDVDRQAADRHLVLGTVEFDRGSRAPERRDPR